MKRTLVLPALLVLSACGSGSADDMGAARSSLAEQDFAGARNALIAVLRDDPQNRGALEMLVQAQLRLGDGEAAQGTIERLKRLGAGEAALATWRAEALLLMGNAEQALAALGQATSPDASRIRATAQLALEDREAAGNTFRGALAAGWDLRLAAGYFDYLMTGGDVDEARRTLTQMEVRAPDSLETLLAAGQLALATGDVATASQSYETAGKRYARRAEPLCGQAEALDAQGQSARALELVEQADKLQPGHRCVGQLRLSLWAVLGQWDKIRTAVQPRETELDPRSAEAMTYGEALIQLDRPEQARALFSRALLAMPNNPFARLMLAKAQLATGDAATALETIRPLADSSLGGPRELELAAEAAGAVGSPDAARYSERSRSADLARRQELSSKGLAALNSEDWNAAIAIYQQLLAGNEDAAILQRLAWAASNAGRHDEAIVYADRALRQGPDNADAQHLAGIARINAGRDLARGIDLVRMALKQEPSNPRFLRSLEKAKATAR